MVRIRCEQSLAALPRAHTLHQEIQCGKGFSQAYLEKKPFKIHGNQELKMTR